MLSYIIGVSTTVINAETQIKLHNCALPSVLPVCCNANDNLLQLASRPFPQPAPVVMNVSMMTHFSPVNIKGFQERFVGSDNALKGHFSML